MLYNILSSPLTTFLKSVHGRVVRWAYNFDGVDDRGQLWFRVINPDGDIDIEFSTGPSVPPVGAASCIVDQSISSTFTSKEFYLQLNSANCMQVIHGGNYLSSNTGVAIEPNTRYGVQLTGNTLRYFKNGAQTQQITVIRGAAREPAATTKIGAWGFGAGFGGFYSGQIYDVKINGVFYPMNSRNQSVLIPSPSGLGPELITQSVLENPAFVGSQWTYLGGGRWQLISDGSYNGLIFLTSGGQPEAGFVEFEIESISGGSIRCSEGSANLVANSQFNTTGVKRWFFVKKGLDNRLTFSRQSSGVPVTAIIKNISYKPLWTTNNTNLWAARNLIQANSATVSTITSGSRWSITRTGTGIPADGGRSSDISTLEVGSLYAFIVDSSAPVHLALYDSGFVLKENQLTNTLIFRALSINKLYISPATQNLAVTVSNPQLIKLDSLCNPMILSNATSDRWTEIEE